MKHTMILDYENDREMGFQGLSIHLPQDMFWPAVMTVLCLGVVLVESVIAIMLVASH